MGNKLKWGIASLICCLAVTAACSNNEPAAPKAASGNGKEAGKTESADPLGKYDPPIEMTTWRVVNSSFKFTNGETINDNVWYRAYKDLLGINLKNIWTVNDTNGSGDQKINVSIASNDIPDVMEVNPTQFKQLVDADLAEDLTKIYEQTASPLLKSIVEMDPNTLKAAFLNGKLMAMPNPYPAIEHARVLWVRADWLKNVNLPAPKTMQDVYAISKAFATMDPDKNGKNDTFGLAVNKDITTGGIADIQGFANGFHAYPDYWIKDSSGKLAFGSIQPEMKNVLAKLNELYKNGEIDKEFGVKDTTQIGKDAAAGKIGLEFGQWWNPTLPLQSVVDNDPKADWKAYPLVSVDDKPALAATGNPSGNFYVAKKGSKHPEAVIKMMNLYVEKLYGKTQEPTKYQLNDGIEVFKYGAVRGGPPTKNLNIMEKVGEALKTKDTSQLNDEMKSFYESILKFRAGDPKGWTGEALYGPEGSTRILDKYMKEKLTMPTAFFGPPTKSQAKVQQTLKKLQLEKFTKIILGQDPVDSFDKFVDDWKKLGGDQWTQEVNEWAQANK
ncbi:extracellular solute-binding protein [Paenibacillus piri]|uniref:Extracellular solute-binding protein n=1 Tax=Paenibacillus piri TaxID=2547395 RepID=A0A4R5KZT4_9BACL|nr:extracellular solute-binding protein [Paenibacillus piri]TDG00708.1 extracellular solute-binding protein [Paenibacillus piri]